MATIENLRVDNDQWRYIKEQRIPLTAILRSRASELSDDVATAINSYVRASESIDDFRDHIESYTHTLRAQADKLAATPNKEPFATFSGEASLVPGYVKRFIGEIGQLKVHHLSEQRAPIGQDEASRILRLKTSRGQADVLAALQSTVAELLGVKIDAFSSDRQSSRSGTLAAELDVDDFLVQVNGSGIREALRLVLDFEFTQPDILLLEEPEVHLHPGLEIAMMQYLKRISVQCQIFLTTHSTNFLDIADLSNVYLVTHDTSTHVQLLDVGEAEEAIPQELGIRLSSVFMYDRLAFVEGPSDEQILRTFATTLTINLSRSGVGFVTTGGARNFSYYASGATLAFLNKRRVQLYFIIDKDERDRPEIERLTNLLGELGTLRVLGRREIENYLLAPKALAKYIAEKSSATVCPSSEEVSDVIASISTDLLPIAAERRVLRQICQPVVPNRNSILNRDEGDFVDAAKAELASAMGRLTSAQGEVENLLDSARDELAGFGATELLAAIPGDELLQAVFRKFSLKFNKRKDAPRIAALMEPQEIPAEIRELLVGITAG